MAVLCSANHAQFSLSISSDNAFSDKKCRVNHLWQDLFSDPSQWWDNRLTKRSSRQPDFKHKTTFEALWIHSSLNPPWVKETFATMAFDHISGVPASLVNYAKIQKLTEQGSLKEALNLLELMAQQTYEAPYGAFVCILRGCTRRKALTEGKQVHALIVQTKCDANIFLSNLLIGMYSSCGSVAEALKVFITMPQRNMFSWTSMISAYAKSGQYKEAVSLFQQMHQAGIEPDEVACIVALKACANIAALEQGQQLHLVILKKGFQSNLIVQTALVDLYAKCGCLNEARELFDNMSKRDVISWNAMIAGYAQKGFGKEALELYEQMKCKGIEPDNITLALLLEACASISALQQGKQLHSLVLEKGLETDINVQTSLVDMYAKCGCLKDARELFDNMAQRDVISWTAMIAGYAHGGFGKEALHLYKQMKHEDIEPNIVTLVLLLKACATISDLQEGKQLHSLVLKKGLESETTIQTTLVDMYAKCGCLKDARKLFDNMSKRDVISWNSMIASYAQKGFGKEALDMFEEMKHEGMEPDNITLVLLLKACASNSDLQQGKQLHSIILKEGLESDMTVQTTLVDMYAKCGCLEDARDLFDNMTERDVISWTAMIAGYAQNGFCKEALDLYEQMEHEGMEPDNITLALLLKACASVSALEQGKQLHTLILEKGFESEMTIQNVLVDMYAKCGCLKDARELFDNMTIRDVVSWSIMIAGYAQQGLGREALDLFKQMKDEGLQANEVTYTCILSAFSHSGLLNEGRYVFDSMSKDHKVTPSLEHYACMVDLLGRAGCLSDAEDFILKMPIQPGKKVWMSLLGAARKYANVDIGRGAFERIVELEPENASPYLLLMDIYSASGQMDEVGQIQIKMNDRFKKSVQV